MLTMKNVVKIVLLLFSIIGGEIKAQDSFQALKKEFQNPGKEYRSAPLWVWNTDVSYEIIDFFLEDLKSKGFGGVFVHPRPGLITAYLSEEWFDKYRYTVEQAKKLDLQVWIYDENSYPSGFAGGHVPAQMPESYNQGQMLNLEIADTYKRDDNTFLLIQEVSDGIFKNIDPLVDHHTKGIYYVFKKQNYEQSAWYGGYSYVDVMVKGVAEKFMEVTMKGYEKHIGEEFGKVVPGVFTDEPNIEVQGRNNIRWTPDLFNIFKEKWGYALEDHLPSLYVEKGDWKRVRHNYYETLLQLFIDRWSKPWYEYTSQRNLEWTGHYWEHGWPNPNHGGDNMAMYAWHQRPGIDMLFNQFDEESPNAQFGNIRAVKELSSVANQIGAKRTLSETYGGAGWELSFKDMKRLGDWQYALGVNTLNQHLSFMSITGARKYDYPPSFSYHNPWWPYYRDLNDYFARLSLALSTGEQINDILVIEPTTTTWMYSTFEGDNTRRNKIGGDFQSFVRHLENNQVEYDLGSENIIKDRGSVKGNQFVIGKRKYKTVIIPPGMENIDAGTYRLLQEFVANNGQVYALNKLEFINGEERMTELNELNKRLIKELDVKRLSEKYQIIEQGNSTKHLYHHRRIVSEGEILFFSNSSLDNKIEVLLQQDFNHIYQLDLFTGKIQPFDAEIIDNQLRLSLQPVESILLFFSKSSLKETENIDVQNRDLLEKDRKIDIPTEVEYIDDNVLTIDFCDIKIENHHERNLHVYNASDKLFKYFDFRDGNPWSTSVQYKDETIKKNNFSSNRPIEVDYYFDINENTLFDSLRVAIERDSLWQISLNGNVLTDHNRGWFLDKGIGVFDISKYAKSGRNKLTLSRKSMHILAEIEPVYVLGTFGLEAIDRGWKIINQEKPKLGAWKDNGRPLYGFSVSYKKKLFLDPSKKYKVRLNDWRGTAAVVKINGIETANISYPPHEAVISAPDQGGLHTVEVIVVGSLKNTLGPFHNNPKPGMVSPWHFRNVKDYNSGSTYQLHEYGLLEDFDLIEIDKQ